MRKPSLMMGITLLLLLICAITTLAVHLSQREITPTAGTEIKNPDPNYFPLHPGNYWEYAYHSREAVGSNDIVSKDQIIRMEVLSSTKAGDYELVAMSGDPIYFNPQGYFGLAVSIESQKIYYLDNLLLKRLLTDVKKKTFKPDSVTNYGRILFEFPLHDGQTYGSEGPERQDTLYMYAVKRNGSYPGSGIKPDQPLPLYQVCYACIADVMTYDFVPGLGITRATYHHNGTVIDYDVKLTGCQIN